MRSDGDVEQFILLLIVECVENSLKRCTSYEYLDQFISTIESLRFCEVCCCNLGALFSREYMSNAVVRIKYVACIIKETNKYTFALQVLNLIKNKY